MWNFQITEVKNKFEITSCITVFNKLASDFSHLLLKMFKLVLNVSCLESNEATIESSRGAIKTNENTFRGKVLGFSSNSLPRNIFFSPSYFIYWTQSLWTKGSAVNENVDSKNVKFKFMNKNLRENVERNIQMILKISQS